VMCGSRHGVGDPVPVRAKVPAATGIGFFQE